MQHNRVKYKSAFKWHLFCNIGLTKIGRKFSFMFYIYSSRPIKLCSKRNNTKLESNLLINQIKFNLKLRNKFLANSDLTIDINQIVMYQKIPKIYFLYNCTAYLFTIYSHELSIWSLILLKRGNDVEISLI